MELECLVNETYIGGSRRKHQLVEYRLRIGITMARRFRVALVLCLLLAAAKRMLLTRLQQKDIAEDRLLTEMVHFSNAQCLICPFRQRAFLKTVVPWVSWKKSYGFSSAHDSSTFETPIV